MSEAQVILAPNQTSLDGPSTIVLAEPGKKKKGKFVNIIPFQIPDPLPTLPNTGTVWKKLIKNILKFLSKTSMSFLIITIIFLNLNSPVV